MMKKILPIVFMAVILVASGAFYSGLKYGQSKSPAMFRDSGNFANLSPQERQARFQQLGAGGTPQGPSNSGGNAFGEIISKDDKSITVKLRDSGSKIIFYSDTTEINKLVNGAPSDLEVGKTIAITGQSNQDGSLLAQTIQIRPEGLTPPN